MVGSGSCRGQMKQWLFCTALWEQTPYFPHPATISKPMYAGLKASPSVYIQGDEVCLSFQLFQTCFCPNSPF